MYDAYSNHCAIYMHYYAYARLVNLTDLSVTRQVYQIMLKITLD